MYRYEVTESVKNEVHAKIGKPYFYLDGGKWYVDQPNTEKSVRYYDSVTDTFKTETIDEIFNDLYGSDLVSNSTQSTFEPIDTVNLSSTDDLGRPMVTLDKPAGNFDTVITHNWCDNTTWTATNDSTWKLEPASGEFLNVVKAEVQFENDIAFGVKELYLDYYVWHPASPGVPVLGQRITFAHLRDLFALGNSHFSTPAIGAELPTGITTIIFDYANKLTFTSVESPGALAYLQISTKDNLPITGTYATVGFVVRSESV